MRFLALAFIAIFMISVLQVSADAAKRTPRGPSGKYDKEKQETVKKEKKESEKAAEEKSPTENLKPPAPQELLMKMAAYEGSLGILDYKVEVVEVTTAATTNKTQSDRKEIYYLAPVRSLTLKDGIPVSYTDEFQMSKIINQVNLKQLPDESINGVDCVVLEMTPAEKVFEKNVKHYYLAKDNNRKIRIESIRFNADGQSVYNVTDFFYRMVDDQYLLPLKSESRLYDSRNLLLQTTTATFVNWKFNLGLTPEFFNKKMGVYKLYDTVK